MADIVKEAVKTACESHTDFSTLPDGTRQQILEAVMGDNGFIILIFLKHIRDHGPDECAQNSDKNAGRLMAYLNPEGWVWAGAINIFLNHLISRLEAKP